MLARSTTYTRKPRWRLLALMIVTTGLLISCVILYVNSTNFKTKVIPVTVAEKVLFTVYEPQLLPPGYSVDDSSFTIREGALLFSASDNRYNHIAFSEQILPPQFDFTAFYQQNLTDVTNFRGAPYPSVTGTLSDGRRILSVTTKTTWIIMTTIAPLSTEDIRLIAKNVQPD